MPRRHFALGTSIGALPPALVYTYFATALIDGVEGARTEAMGKALIGAGGMFCLAMAPKVWRWWKAREAPASITSVSDRKK